MREHPEPKPRHDKDAAKDIARDLAEIASHIGQLKGDARAYLSDPNDNALKLRLEGAHSAVERLPQLRPGGGCGSTRGGSGESTCPGGRTEAVVA